MSGDVSDKKRLVSITRGNLAHKHIYLSGHHDFFPDECYGESKRTKGTGKELELLVEGLEKPVKTDIGLDGSNGKPRNFFRNRKWVQKFFEKNNIREGDVVAIEKLNSFTYRIYPFESKIVRNNSAIQNHLPKIDNDSSTEIDLFAGCVDRVKSSKNILEYFGYAPLPGWPDKFGRNIAKWVEKSKLPSIRTLSLFTGAGGLDIGFHQSGFNVLQMVEIDERFVTTLRANCGNGKFFESSLPLCADVRDFIPIADLNVDLIIGGPPCQTFSAAGRRAGGVSGASDLRGRLFQAYVNLLRLLKPKAFVFENVYGITGANKGKDWNIICEAFKSVGYNVFVRILDAADFGVPQHRERMFIVGTRSGGYRFPRPIHGPDSFLKLPFYTASMAVEGANLTESESEAAVNGIYGELLDEIPPGLNYSFFTAQMGHPKPFFAWRSKFSDFLYKADPSKPVRTIKAQGGQYTGPFHWENRPFGIGEMKRLQTFPDDYIVVGGRSVAVHQIGNSVPPQMARILALSMQSQIFENTLPFEIPLLNEDEELGFRRRKRSLTREYFSKARCAIMASEHLMQPKRPRRRDYTGELTSDFKWRVIRDKRKGVRISFIPRKSKWIFNAIDVRGKTSKFTITIKPKLRNDWSIPSSMVVLSGNSLIRDTYTGCWKAFEAELARLCIKADLVQLFGYYQYEPSIKAKMDIRSPCNDHWLVVSRIVSGIGIRQIMPVAQASSLWGISANSLWDVAEFLRTLGYEVRNSNTNPQIPEGSILVPYAFPTLSHNSVQLRKELG